MRLVWSLMFSVSVDRSECWTDKPKIDAFEIYCWPRMLRVLWTEKRTKQFILDQLGIKKRLNVVVTDKLAKLFGQVVRRKRQERLTPEGNR